MCIYNWDCNTMTDQNVRLIIAITGKDAYKYMCQDFRMLFLIKLILNSLIHP